MTGRSSWIPVLLAGLAITSSARADVLSGVVVDAQYGTPIEAVTVILLEPGMSKPLGVTHTDGAGRFEFHVTADRTSSLAFSRIGYRMRQVDHLVPGSPGSDALVIRLIPAAIVMDPVVVTASRRREPGHLAPASISVVDRERIRDSPARTPVEHVRTATGVDFASKGIMQHSFAVRGSRSVNSAAVLLLTDYRYAAVPSLGLNIGYLLAPVDEDIERIELLRGPAAALYGPDTDRGVLHVITRAPLKSAGTVVSVSGGERSLRQFSLRHAGRLNERLGYKISSEYLRGHDWEYTDPTERELRRAALENGGDPASLLVGKRDFEAERATTEVRLDWQPDPGTSVVLNGGGAEAINAVDVTPTAGAIQVRNWRYSYVQSQFRKGRLFLNLMHNMSDAGDTYFLRTGLPVVDNSRMSALQLQHGADLDGRNRLLYGVDVRRTEPRTGRTIHGSHEDRDTMTEAGAYVQANSTILPSLDVVGALRTDYHDRVNSLVVSPRVGAVFHPGASHSARLVYNRAFNSPSSVDLFADFLAESIGPFGVRVAAIPRSGFSFDRNPECGCLTMRVPGQSGPLPADATLAWAGLVEIAGSEGIDLRRIPPPSGTDVGTDLRALDPQRGGFLIPVSPDEPGSLEPLRRQMTNSIELGYKGRIGKRIVAGLDLYHNRVTDPTGALFAGTPSVFLDRDMLESYLVASGMTADSAAAAAELVSGIPVGTIVPREAGNSADILLLTRQGGSYSNVGADVSLEFRISDRFSGRANYSWIRRNVFNDVDVVGRVVLGVPRNKGSLGIGYHDDAAGLSAWMQVRALESFPVANGLSRGTVDASAVVDLDAGFRLPWERRMSISVNAANVLDHRHAEYVGTPGIGRLVSGRIRYSFQAE